MTVLNSPFEVGLRTSLLLSDVYPASLNINQLVILDHLLLHTADVDGPPSLLPELPNRVGELGLKRTLIERGVEVMVGIGIIEFELTADGVNYLIADRAASVLGLMQTQFSRQLRERTVWLSQNLPSLSEVDLRSQLQSTFDRWAEEIDLPAERELEI